MGRLDGEQIELGTSAKFWKRMQSRRNEKALSRAELEQAVKQKAARGKRS